MVAVQIARGRSLSELLGAYSVVGDVATTWAKPLRYLVYHLAELDLYLGVIPSRPRSCWSREPAADRPLQAFLAVTLSLTGWFAVVVATFASQFANRIQERNLFVVAPLFLDAPARLGRARGSAAAYLAPVAAVALGTLRCLAIPFEPSSRRRRSRTRSMLLPWWAILSTRS